MRHVEACNKPRSELTAEDFPLPQLLPRLAAWRNQIEHGRGFVVLRGLPVERWSTGQAETVFWCLGWHLGVPGAQNRDGDLLGHVCDTGADVEDWTVREYRTNVPIAFHCDAADAVGLLCLRPAASGGLSRIASSVTIFNEVQRREPRLARRLFEPMGLDARGEAGLQFMRINPARFYAGRLRTFWHSGYFRSVARYPDAPVIDPDQQQVMDLFDAIADEPGMALEMDLQPGDIQLVSNHCVVHARSGYIDDDDPACRRHLLRLWLSFDESPGIAETWNRTRSKIGLAAQLARARWVQRGRFAKATAQHGKA